MSKSSANPAIQYKAATQGAINLDEAKGIVECFVAGIGNKDSVGDVCAPGAFSKSLMRRKPRVVWGHNWNDPIGKVLEIYEVPPNDPRLPGKMRSAGIGGLYARVQFNLMSEKGKEAFASVAFFGEEQEWSIGYKTINAKFDQQMQANVLYEVELYEVSPVLHGANQLTGTISVKSDENSAVAVMERAVSSIADIGNANSSELKEVLDALKKIASSVSEDEKCGPGMPHMQRPATPSGMPSAPATGPAPRSVVKPTRPSIPENPMVVALRRELVARTGSNIIVRSAGDNVVVFDRVMSDGTASTYRLAYHYASGEFMFGKPEKVSAQTVYTPETPGASGDAYWGDDYSEMPKSLGFDEFWGSGFGSEINFQADTGNALMGVIESLQQIIDEKSEYVIPVEPTEAFEFKQMIDPVLEYYKADARVTEEGIVVKSAHNPELIEALDVATKSVLGKIRRGIGAGRRLDAPNIGGGKGRSRAARAIGAATGGVAGNLDPSKISMNDPDGDGWAKEGSKNPVWVGFKKATQKLTGGGKKKPSKDEQRARSAVNADRPGPPRPGTQRAWDAPSVPAPPRPSRVTLTDDAGARLREASRQRARELGFDRSVDPAPPRPRKKLTNQVTRAPRPGDGGRKPSGESIANAIRRETSASSPVLGQQLANDISKYGYPEEMSTDDLIRTVADFRRELTSARRDFEKLQSDRFSGKDVPSMEIKKARQRIDSLRQRASVYSSEISKRDKVKGNDRFSSGKAVTPEAKRMRRHAPIGTTGEFDLPEEIAAREKHEAFVEEFKKQNGFWRDIPRAGTVNSMNTSEEWQRAREISHNVAIREWEETELNRRPKDFSEKARASVDYLTWYGNFAKRMGGYLDREEASENITDDELSGARAAVLEVLAEKRAVPGSREALSNLEKMMDDAGFGPNGRHETPWGGRKRTSVTGFSSGRTIDRNVMKSLKDDGLALDDDDVVAILLPNSGLIVHKTLTARKDDSSLNWKNILGDSKVEPKDPTSPRAMIRLDAEGFQKLSDAMDAANSEFVPGQLLPPHIGTIKDKDFPYSYPPSTRFSSGSKYAPEIEDELWLDSELGGNRAADRINTENVDMEIVPSSDIGLDGPDAGAWTVVGMYRGEDYGSVDYIYETDTFDSVEEARRFIETYDRLIEEEIRPGDPEFFLDINNYNRSNKISLDDDLDSAIDKAVQTRKDRENAPYDYGSLISSLLSDRALNVFGDGESRFSSGRNKAERRQDVKRVMATNMADRKVNLGILSRRMKGETLDEVGRAYGLDRGTVRQMEMREMKRLRDGATPSEILAYRMEGLTLDDMSRMLGMSREDVRRIESREIARMRLDGRDGSDAIFEGRKAGLSRESIERITGLSADDIETKERKGFERAVTREDVSYQIFDKYVTNFGEDELTDAELAEELGVSERIVSEVRAGANKNILDARRDMDEYYRSLPEPTDEELQAEANYYADNFAREQGFSSYGEYEEYLSSVGKEEGGARLSSGLVRQMTIENPLLIGTLAGIASSKIQRRRRERLDEDEEYLDDDDNDERFSSGAGKSSLTPSQKVGQRVFDEASKIAKEDKKDIFDTMDALIFDERFDSVNRGEKLDTNEMYAHINALLYPEGAKESKKRRLWRRERLSSGGSSSEIRKKKRAKIKQKAWSEEDLQRFRDRNILKAKTRPGKRKNGPSAEEFSSGRKRIDTAGSSALTGAFYDADNERLVVGFNKGGVYAYDGVTPGDIEELHNAESKGAAMASIKKKYKGVRLSEADDSLKATKQGDEWVVNPDNETTYSISEDGGEFFVLRTTGSYARDGGQSGDEYYHPESFKNMDSAMKWVEQDFLPSITPEPWDEDDYDVDRFSSGGPVRAANLMQFDTRRSRRASNMTYDPQDGRVGVTYNDGSERFFSEVPYEAASSAGNPAKDIDDFIDDLEKGKVGREGGRFSSGAGSVPRTDWDYSYQKFPPTEEQAVIADAVATGENVIVRAFAGTGKTSTLVTIAERLKRQDPKKRIVYMAFNKDIQLEAEGRFPGNTESRTGDSISWNWVKQTMGKAFTDRMGSNAPERVKSKGTRNKDISVHFKIKQMEHPDGLKDSTTGSPVVLDAVDVTKLVREAVKQFLISEDDEIGAQHFKTIQNVPPVLLGHAKAIWDDMNDPDGVMKLDNSVFTKMWALSRPQLSEGVGLFKGKPSVIFFDEAQDINPVMARVMREQNIQVVFVGDSYQAIYGFRGASDSLEKAEAAYDLPLTGSWRFDSKIAGYANRFLAYMGSKNRIRGVGKPGNGVVEPESMVDPDAILTRSNGGALRAVVEQIQLGRTVGTSENFKKDLTRFAWHAVMLKAGKQVKNPHEELEEFSSWKEVQDAASAEDASPRLRMLVQLFNDTPNIIDILDQVVVGGKLKGESGGGSGKRILPSEITDGFEMSIDPGSMGKWAGDKKTQVLYKNGKLFLQLPYTKYPSSDSDAKFEWQKQNLNPIGKVQKGKPDETNGKYAIWVDATPEQAAELLSGITSGDAQEVDVMVMTAHRSKGLEFGRVRLYGDFPRPRLNKKTNEMEYPSPEEQRLQYVASTRAIRELDPGPTDWIYGETSEDDESPDVPGGFSSGARGNPIPSAIGKDMVLEDGGTLEDNMFKGTYIADFNGGKMVIQPAGRDSWAVYRADFSGGEDGPSYSFSYGPPSDDAEFGSLADAYEHVLNYVKENDISLDSLDGTRRSKGSESFSEAKISNSDSGIAQRFSSGRKDADKRLKEARKSSSKKGDKAEGKDSRLDRAVDAYLNYVFGANQSSRLSSGRSQENNGVSKRDAEDVEILANYYMNSYGGYDDELGDWLDSNPGKTENDYISSQEFSERVDEMENVMADAGDSMAENRLDEYANRRLGSGANSERPSDEDIYNLRMSGPTLEEVGEQYGMTRQEVRAAEMRHIRRMRDEGFESTGTPTSRRERRLSSGANRGGIKRSTNSGVARKDGKVVLARRTEVSQGWTGAPEEYLKPDDDFFDAESASRILNNPLESYNDQTGWPVPAKEFFQSLVLGRPGQDVDVMDEDGKFTTDGRLRIKSLLTGSEAAKEKFIDRIESGEVSHMQAVSAMTLLEKIGMNVGDASDHMFETFGFKSAPVWVSGLDARDPDYDLIRGEVNWSPLTEEQWVDEIKQAYVDNANISQYAKNRRDWVTRNKGKSEKDYEASPEFLQDAKRAYLYNKGVMGPAEVYSHPYSHFYAMREDQRDAVKKNWLSQNPGKTDADYDEAMSWGGEGDPDLSPLVGGWGFGDPRKAASTTLQPEAGSPTKRPVSPQPSSSTKSSLSPDTTRRLFKAFKRDVILSAAGINEGTNREKAKKLSELVGFDINEETFDRYRKDGVSPRVVIELLRKGHIKNLSGIGNADRANDDLNALVREANKSVFVSTAFGRIREAARAAGLSDESFGRSLWKMLSKDHEVHVFGKGDRGVPRSGMADGGIPATFNLSKLDLLGESELTTLVDGLNKMAESEGSSARFSIDEIFPRDGDAFADPFGESKIRMSSGASPVKGQRFVAKPKENRLTAAARETAEMRFSSAARPTYRTAGGGIDKDAMSADIDDAIRGPRLGAVAITTANADNVGREQIDNLARAITLRQHIADMFPSVVNDRTGVSYDIEPLLIEQGLDPKDAEKLTDLVNDLDDYIDGIVGQFEEEGDKLESGLRRMNDMLDEVESLRKYRKETIEKYGEDDARNLVARLDDKINKLTTSIDEEYQATIGSNRTNMAKLRDEALALVDDNPGFEKPKAGSDGPRLSSGANSLSSKLIALEMSMGRSAEGGLPKYTPVSKIDFNVPSGTRLSSGKADEWYENLTAKLIEQIEKVQASGGDTWQFPWHRTTSMPKNGISNHVFSGMNPFVLMLSADEKGYTSNKWATYNQWQSVGGQVRKGEKGTQILAPVFKKVKDPDTGKEETKLVNWRTYSVFNLEQIEGINPDDYKDDPKELLDEAARVEKVDKAFSAVGAEIETGDGSSAHYSPSKDKVVMPPFAYFKTPEGYYATLGHELVHWTGHTSRLDRPNMNRFGTPEYAREELVAELGAAFLMANFGLSAEPREDHAHYLANWLKVLREEPKALQEAAREAQKASKLLIEKMRQVLEDAGVAEETIEDVVEEKTAKVGMFSGSESNSLLQVAGALPAYLRMEVEAAIKSTASEEVLSTKVINRISKTIELLETFSKQKGI